MPSAADKISITGNDTLARTLAECPEGFGEILRHELNNPLTGILGNAELLLAEVRKKSGAGLSEAGLNRLETITGLAVRMRETVRRLSQACEPQPDVPSANLAASEK
jgi:signal transduction histidine kinase